MCLLQKAKVSPSHNNKFYLHMLRQIKNNSDRYDIDIVRSHQFSSGPLILMLMTLYRWFSLNKVIPLCN